MRLDERAGTPLGQLLLIGALNDGATSAIEAAASFRYQAGMLFAQIAVEYRGVIEAPSSISGSGRVLLCEVNYCRDNGDMCTCYRRKIRYQEAYFALAGAGRAAAHAVQQVAVFGEPIGIAGIIYLKEGLDRLAEHFCLTARTERRHIKKYTINSYA